RQSRIQQICIYMLSAACSVSLRQCSQYAHASHIARHHIHHRRLHFTWFSVWHAYQAHQARICLQDAIDSSTSSIGTLLPICRNRAVDKSRKFVLQLFITQSSANHCSWTHAFNNNICFAYQIQSNSQAFFTFNVQGNALFSSIKTVE